MKARLAALLLVALAAPAWAYDKAPTPQKRLEILKGATRRDDAGELGSCYAPPFDQAIGEVWKGSLRHDRALAVIGEAIVAKMDPQAFVGTPLELTIDAFSPFHFALKGEFSIGEVKPDPSDEAKAHVLVKLDADQDGCRDVVTTLLLVKIKDDWRIVFDNEVWSSKASVEIMARSTLEIGRALDRAAVDLEKIGADLNNAMGDQIPTKEKLVARFSSVAEPVKKAVESFRAARAEAASLDKADRDKAAQAEREAQEKAKADAEAKAKAEAEAKKLEAQRKADEAKAALPPPQPPPPIVKVERPEDKPLEVKSDNTGLYVVFGLLAIACIVVVGIVLSKAKEQEGGGGGGRRKGGGGGGSGDKRSGTGRHKRRRK